VTTKAQGFKEPSMRTRSRCSTSSKDEVSGCDADDRERQTTRWRSTPWQAAKMAATLQAATTSSRPILLLRVDYSGGHGLIGGDRKSSGGPDRRRVQFLAVAVRRSGLSAALIGRVQGRQIESSHRSVRVRAAGPGARSSRCRVTSSRRARLREHVERLHRAQTVPRARTRNATSAAPRVGRVARKVPQVRHRRLLRSPASVASPLPLRGGRGRRSQPPPAAARLAPGVRDRALSTRPCSEPHPPVNPRCVLRSRAASATAGRISLPSIPIRLRRSRRHREEDQRTVAFRPSSNQTRVAPIGRRPGASQRRGGERRTPSDALECPPECHS